MACLALGCFSPPPFTELTLVATRPAAVRARVVQEDVRGQWCFSENVVRASLRPPWRARLADHGRAIRAALDDTPGANVLLDVTVDVRVEQYLLFQRICAIATGDAAVIE